MINKHCRNRYRFLAQFKQGMQHLTGAAGIAFQDEFGQVVYTRLQALGGHIVNNRRRDLAVLAKGRQLVQFVQQGLHIRTHHRDQISRLVRLQRSAPLFGAANQHFYQVALGACVQLHRVPGLSKSFNNAVPALFLFCVHRQRLVGKYQNRGVRHILEICLNILHVRLFVKGKVIDQHQITAAHHRESICIVEHIGQLRAVLFINMYIKIRKGRVHRLFLNLANIVVL